MNYQNETLNLDSPSSEDFDYICLDQDIANIDISMTARQRHFLDYDAAPPPGFEEDYSLLGIKSASTLTSCPGETVKLDKKYEKDGEISDYELAASGVTKKLLASQSKNEIEVGTQKRQHFLDENAVAPECMLEKEREHRSLDRDFERKWVYKDICFEWKHSLDRKSRIPKANVENDYLQPVHFDNNFLCSNRGTWPTEKPSDSSDHYASMPSGNTLNLGSKVECVYSLLSMLGSHDSVEMSKKFLELSRSTETCTTLRRSGCISLLVQMMHSENDESVQKRAAIALHNVVHSHPDDKIGRREAKVLRLIEQIMEYCSFLKTLLMSGGEAIADDADRHPLAATSSLMKISFDEEHRQAMCQLGALQAIASLVHLDHAVHGPKSSDQCCNSLRRYALMALTNLTFGDGNNKAFLCANKEFMEALVAQLDLAPDDLLQVTASVLRNLSWRADNNMKTILNQIGTVTALAKAAMKNRNENTLKAILSALWNLSAHCSTNKAEFCAVDGALAFLVDMLNYEGPSKTLKIIENAGGILRNVSSHIAVREDYRKILRQRNCLGILLQQLKSESLTVVSNACGTLWNLSARFPEDQKFLWDNGAVPMLRSLIHSKHRMISEGSSAALKNLLNFRPGTINQNNFDPIAKSMGLRVLPTLNARKQKALEQELNQNLAETCENLDALTPARDKVELLMCEAEKMQSPKNRLTKSAIVFKSESRDSVISVKSDSIYEKLQTNRSVLTHGDEIKAINNVFDLRTNFAVAPGFDVEQTELPIDYSAKYNIEDNSSQKLSDMKSKRKCGSRNYSTYQETDLDQLTDFSLRYAENQIESDSEEKVIRSTGNEIILIMEDTVKCYQTEDTPYVISNAGSDLDLRNSRLDESSASRKRIAQKHEASNNICFSGSYTPEKPINYCEEGTPGYFSRYESLSSLDEVFPNSSNILRAKPEVVEEEVSCIEQIIKSFPDQNSQLPISEAKIENKVAMPTATMETTQTDGGPYLPKVPSAVNSAQETPLMFSRRSSMDSLASAEPITADDKSSVVSDFSRLASGIISPSELPDSPTQSMPQSPRRNSNNSVAFSNLLPQIATSRMIAQPRLRSLFEDDISIFQVENTPAHFSSATSLSNLSIDDEPKITTDILCKEMALLEIEQLEKTKDEIFKKNGSASEGCAYSEGEETTNDKILLATCINIGMKRHTFSLKSSESFQNKNSKEHENGQKGTNSAEDPVKQYYTEDTPALLSKVGSNSNLSALSLSTNRGDIVSVSDETSNTSDSGTELLQQCIREGMQKPSSSKQKTSVPKRAQYNSVASKDPIAMLRRGGLPPYLPVRDEMNKFVVEDSPCNFSVISALSNLSVGSEFVGPANLKRVTGEDQNMVKISKVGTSREGKEVIDDSLSSISVDSEDDTNLLSQAIAAGCSRPKSNQGKIGSTYKEFHNFINVPPVNDPNDSISSVGSNDSNENEAKTLFEQCIRTGMSTKKKEEIPATKKATLENKKTLVDLNVEKQREIELKDEQLIRECINTGIARSADSHIKPPTRFVCQILRPTSFNQKLITEKVTLPNMLPKNEETTSVAVLEQHQQEVARFQSAPNMAPGVGMKELSDGTNNELEGQQTENSQNIIGSDPGRISKRLSSNVSGFIMDISNEFVIKNDSTKSIIHKKHKDPDLMLKSVERLTQELVSTAEFLRTNAVNNMHLEDNYENNKKNTDGKKSISNSNNTWNEDTCPNDISFPSVSISAPMISSLNDDETTISDLNPEIVHQKVIDITSAKEVNHFSPLNIKNVVTDDYSSTIKVREQSNSNQNSLETETETLMNDNISNTDYTSSNNSGIEFELGGEVQQFFNTSTSQFSFSGDVFLTSLPSMTNLTGMANEVHKTEELVNMTKSIASLDLENIRPPSCMDFLSSSSFLDAPEGSQPTKVRKKSLPLGLMAKRALGGDQFYGGLSYSAESVNSSCNLDNVKPPSLMDELLDSMISVDSITSEVFDSNLGVHSNFAASFCEVDDKTTTLQRFMGLNLMDYESSETPIPSDLSSAESTPRKGGINVNSPISSVKGTFTPKQKRRLIKDRYKTYTIAADYILNENNSSGDQQTVLDTVDNETIFKEELQQNEMKKQIESPKVIKTNSIERTESSQNDTEEFRQILGIRRALDPDRFKTRTIFCVGATLQTNKMLIGVDPFAEQTSLTSTEDDSEDVSLIQDFTKQIKHICQVKPPLEVTPPDVLLSPPMTKLIDDETRTTTESDYNSMEFDQNSETESCDQNTYHASEEISSQIKLQPIIPKFGDKDSGTDLNFSEDGMIPTKDYKTVRGRRKPLYVSPYKRTVLPSNDSKSVPSNIQIGYTACRGNIALKRSSENKRSSNANSILKNQNKISKAQESIIRYPSNTYTNKINMKSTLISSKFCVGKKSVIVGNNVINKKVNTLIKQKSTKTEISSGLRGLERQGTFVKDEACNSEIPIVTSLPPTTGKSPKFLAKCCNTSKNTNIPKAPARYLPVKQRSSIKKKSNSKDSRISTNLFSPLRSESYNSPKDLKNKTLAGVGNSSGILTAPRRSKSNTSLRTPKSFVTNQNALPSTTPPSRSNSNLTFGRPVIESRIASIWKKSADMKNVIAPKNKISIVKLTGH